MMDLVMVNPQELTIVSNVRVAKASADLVASIQEHGLLEPINAYRTDDGALVVKHGHRRTLAAIEAGLDQAPVILTAAPAEDEGGKIDLIAAQWDENQQRENLSAREQADTIAQLAAFGVTPAQIAKRLRVDRPTVDAATSLKTTDTLDQYQLTIVQAAALDEFAEDDEAVQLLAEAAASGQFDHQVSRLRQARKVAAVLAEARDHWQAKGVQVLDEWADARGGEWVSSLVDATTNEAVEVDLDNPGPHLAVYLSDQIVTVHTATGDEVARWTVRAADDPNRPEGALTHADVHEEIRVRVRWFCLDPAARNWKARWGGSAAESSAEMTDEEREAKRAERRDVIAANKAWLAAEQVRRDWLRDFCARKSAPKDGAVFIAQTLAADPQLLADHRAVGAQRDYLNLDGIDTVSPARAGLLALAMCLIAHEAATDKNSWRRGRRTAAYLRYIESQGYALSPVERRACGEAVSTDEL